MRLVGRRLFLLLGLLLLAPDAARAEVLAHAPGVSLGTGPVRIPLARGTDLAARMRALPRGQRVQLILRGLHAEAPPGVLYGLFLTGSDAPTPAAADAPGAVGMVNFFAAVPPNDRAPTVSFDVTAAVGAWLTGGTPPADLMLIIIPAGSPAAAGARIEAVDLIGG